VKGFLVITPALFTSTSASIPSSASSIAAGFERSTTIGRQDPPLAAISRLSWSSSFPSRASANTSRSVARRTAIARPIPRDAPVTIAVRRVATSGDGDATEDLPAQAHGKCE
jgi:hypothetical protein